MKKYTIKPAAPLVVDAVQITDAMFDADHPSELHVAGVWYDPVDRIATIDGAAGKGAKAGLGDWIIVDANRRPSFMTAAAFARRAEEYVEPTPIYIPPEARASA
jgi:hypothetical protein